MRERPILFSGPMVRAILNGRKTQTRRVMKPQPRQLTENMSGTGSGWVHEPCQYGTVGDRLWVRETFQGPFHESVPDAWIDRVFLVMMLAPQHTFQVLTKRAARAAEYFAAGFKARSAALIAEWQKTDVEVARAGPRAFLWPLPNVWLGVSVEDQAAADERIPYLLGCPAFVRFLSCEPLLGPILLDRDYGNWLRKLHWVIAGGESGHGARPMHPDWARSLRDQCAAAGVPFFFKQWGEHRLIYDRERDDPDWRACEVVARRPGRWINLQGGEGFHGDRVHYAERVGKKVAGRLLDGVEHNGMPT